MKNAIAKAIEGDWNPKRQYGANDWHIFVLDPLFWQALSKAMGWRQPQPTTDKLLLLNGEWLVQWHAFIDHLASGKSADDFFIELLK